jgi:hypothetical protein
MDCMNGQLEFDPKKGQDIQIESGTHPDSSTTYRMGSFRPGVNLPELEAGHSQIYNHFILRLFGPALD